MMKNPTVIYSCKGLIHLCYSIWSIRSLHKFRYEPIEVVVSNEREREFFISRCPGIICNIIDVKLKGYPSFSYKPFVLMEYLDKIGIQHKGRDIVICDADILWRQDPAPLFERFNNTSWVHKITAVSPLDYGIPFEDIPQSNIGLRTIQNYARRFGVSVYPNFVLNAGLFMLSEEVFPEMLRVWMDKMLKLPPNEMLMSEALMSLTYAQMRLHPVSDEENIKYLRTRKLDKASNVLEFEIAPPRPDGSYTGYETARHYYGNQRGLLHKEIAAGNLDYDNLLPMVKRGIIIDNVKRLPRLQNKMMGKLRKITAGLIHG